MCFELLRSGEARGKLAGIAVLGGFPDRAILEGSALSAARVPIYFGHGTRDGVYPARQVVALYDAVRTAIPGYPIRLVLFESGIHGTPIRMTDWRETINWMLRGGRG